ncbi:MAG: hypothetical protein GY822_19075 [Deltaproteobacteria bacterium]|nr:hypothetical protein [Deltaproteobacteria bacterium]
MSEPTNNNKTTDFWRRLFEQSFLVICLSLGVVFLFKEYKEIFTKLIEKNQRDENILLDALTNSRKGNAEVNRQQQERIEKLYERLIDCKNGKNN